MSRRDHVAEPLLGRNLPPRSLGLCGPECRYRALYEGAQGSLSDMASRQASALGRHGRLRSGVIAALKGVLPRQFAELESRVASRLADVDDEALIAYMSYLLDNALAPRRERAAGGVGAEQLRVALEAAGFAVPAGDDLGTWALAVQQGGQRVAGPRVDAGPAALPVASRLTRSLPQDLTPAVASPRPDGEGRPDVTVPASAGGTTADTTPVAATAMPDDMTPVPAWIAAAQTATTTASVAARPAAMQGGWMQVTMPALPEVAATPPVVPAGAVPGAAADPQVPAWLAAADDAEANFPPRRRTLASVAAAKQARVTSAAPPVSPQTGWDERRVPSAMTTSPFFEPATIEPAGGQPDVSRGAPRDVFVPDMSLVEDLADSVEVRATSDAASAGATATAAPRPMPALPAASPTAADNGWGDVPAPAPADNPRRVARGPVVRPELFPTAPAAKPARTRRPPRSAKLRAETFGGPIPAASDGVLNDEIRARLNALILVPRPVFDEDLVATIGDPDIVQAWKDEMRDAGQISFIPPKPRHRLRGSLVVPRGLLDAAPETFQKSLWADCVAVHKGATLYELAVLFHRVAEQAKSGEVHGHGETVMLRLNQPRGIVGVVVVLGTSFGPGDATRVALVRDVEELLAQPLELLVILATKDPTYDPMVAAVGEEALERSWSPACNVVAARSWEYASGNTSALRQLLG